MIKRHYVWDRSTRIFHWINAFLVIALLVLGTLILNTGKFGIEGESKILLKTIHVYFGYAFVLNLFWRLCWAFIGSHYARWRQFLPIGRNYFLKLKSYISAFDTDNPQQYLGHNPVARIIITVFFVILTLQAFTGLVLAGTDLYKPPFGGYFAEWVTEGDKNLLSELQPGDKTHVVESAYKDMRSFREPVVSLHGFNYFLLLALILIHITGVIVTEIRENNGIVSAMITGEKVLDKEPETED